MKLSRKIIMPAVLAALTAFTTLSPVSAAANEGIKECETHSLKNLYNTTQELSTEFFVVEKQAYSLAKLRLDEALKLKINSKRKLAIVVDLDLVYPEINYFDMPYDPSNKIHYTKRGQDINVSENALEFLNYAANKGVDIFYISNEGNGNARNKMVALRKAGLPFIDTDHVKFANSSSPINNTARVDAGIRGDKVILCLGNNIHDFTSAFKRIFTPYANTQMALLPSFYENFGSKWILIPNRSYRVLENGMNAHAGNTINTPIKTAKRVVSAKISDNGSDTYELELSQDGKRFAKLELKHSRENDDQDHTTLSNRHEITHF